MKRDAKRTEERVKLQNIDLLPYPVKHLVMPVPNDVVVLHTLLQP